VYQADGRGRDRLATEWYGPPGATLTRRRAGMFYGIG
jgi:hypothetical protein